MRPLLRILGALSALIVVALTVTVALSWAPDRPVNALKARWAPPPSQFVNFQGMAVHFRDEGRRGDPIPIVLLHGTSASLHTWDGWVSALEGSRRVIRMDLPGFGLTGPAPGDDYSIAAYTRFVLGFLDLLGVQRFVLAGNSLGGEIAWQVAAAAPQRVERLVLVDAAGYAFAPASMPLGFRIARMPALAWLTERILPRGVIEASVRNVYGDPSRVSDTLVDRYYELTLREGNRAALGRRFRQNAPGKDADRIKTLRLPTLVLWGGKDRLIPPQYAQQFGRDIPGSKVIVYEALGHVPHEEDPAATVADVGRFLAR